MSPKQVLAICGSVREHSANKDLLSAIRLLYPGIIALQLYEGLETLPHFNPDLLPDHIPAAALDFIDRIKTTDAIIISTPEYAMGLPGVLKDAMDWTVAAAAFSGKPVMAITASTSGTKAHASLLGVLEVLEAIMTPDTQLLIPFIKTKVNKEGQITDPATLQQVKTGVQALLQLIA